MQSLKTALREAIQAGEHEGGVSNLSRSLSRRTNRGVSNHDVVKLLWALQKEGYLKLSYQHRDGRSRSGSIRRIEVIR